MDKNTTASSDQSEQSAQSPIFVVGYMHSGTTLLQNILRAAPSVFTGQGETRFFDYLPLIQRKFPDLKTSAGRRAYLTYIAKLIQTRYGFVTYETDATEDLAAFGLNLPQIDELVAIADGVADYALLFRRTFDYLCTCAHKQRWLEKTPTHLYHIDAILQAIPDAHFVALVRDPRDTLVSKEARDGDEWLEQYDEKKRRIMQLQGGYDPLWNTLGWKSAVRAIAAAQKRYPDQVLQIRYEDLVERPSQEVGRICHFLDIEYSDELLAVRRVNTTDRTVAGQQGISASSVGKWQRKLRPEAVALCQMLAQSELKMLGYTIQRPQAVTYAKTPLLLMRSSGEFFERLYRRGRLGGMGYVRNILGNYWRRIVSVNK